MIPRQQLNYNNERCFYAVRAECYTQNKSSESPVSKEVNTEAEEATALEAVTRRQPVKIQQTENTYCVL
jgi:hypothetical protein